MRSGAAFVCAALLLLTQAARAGVLAGSAGGKPLLFSVDSSTLAEWHHAYVEGDQAAGVSPDDYVKLHERLKLELIWEPLTVGARLDGYYYPDQLVVRSQIADP